jgi:hypothetical protein
MDASNNGFIIDNAAPTVAGSVSTSPYCGEVEAVGTSLNIT